MRVLLSEGRVDWTATTPLEEHEAAAGDVAGKALRAAAREGGHEEECAAMVEVGGKRQGSRRQPGSQAVDVPSG